MRSSFDNNGLTSPDDHANVVHLHHVMVTRGAEDEGGPDQDDLSRIELAELRSANHQLRAEILALRSRIERLKSNRSLERSLIAGGIVALWLFFVLSVITKLTVLSN